MKKLLLITLSLGLLLSVTISIDSHANPKSTYSGIFITKIHNTDDEVFNTIQEIISGEPDLSLEYGCTESGILVIKFRNSNQPSQSGNEAMILNKLKKCSSCGEMEIVFSEVHIQGQASEC